MKTKLRIFCIFLCLTVVSNAFADILRNPTYFTLVGEYNGHKVYYRYELNYIESDEELIINGAIAEGEWRSGLGWGYYSYSKSNFREGINIIENIDRTQ